MVGLLLCEICDKKNVFIRSLCFLGATPAKVQRIEPTISGIQALEATSPTEGSDLQCTVISPIESAKKDSISSECSGTAEVQQPSPGVKSSTCRRSASFLELLQTEENYVKILDIILGVSLAARL